MDRNCRDCQVKLTTDNTYAHSRDGLVKRNRCKKCHIKVVQAHDSRANDQTRLTAEHHLQRWDEDEIEFLLEMESEATATEIAEALGRTKFAVQSKLGTIRRAALEEGGAPTGTTRSTITITRVTVTRVVETCLSCFVPRPCFCD